MTKQENKPKGGRPPKREGERLSKNRTFRVRPMLDQQLEAAAAASGRSISEEIERRLEQSFQFEEVLDKAVRAAVRVTLEDIESEKRQKEEDLSKPIDFATLGAPPKDNDGDDK